MTPNHAATGWMASESRRAPCRAAGLLATASLLVLLSRMPDAVALDCARAAGAPPADLATPAALYEALRARTDAQLLAIGFTHKSVAAACTWIYEVKMLTASGAVVELDFTARDLGLIGARGPDNDREIAKLVATFGGLPPPAVTGIANGSGPESHRSGSGSSGSGEGGNSGSGSGSSGSGGGEGGEGGNSGSGSGSSGSGGGEGGEGGNSGSGGGEGGEGGGEGGEGGGDD